MAYIADRLERQLEKLVQTFEAMERTLDSLPDRVCDSLAKKIEDGRVKDHMLSSLTDASSEVRQWALSHMIPKDTDDPLVVMQIKQMALHDREDAVRGGALWWLLKPKRNSSWMEALSDESKQDSIRMETLQLLEVESISDDLAFFARWLADKITNPCYRDSFAWDKNERLSIVTILGDALNVEIPEAKEAVISALCKSTDFGIRDSDEVVRMRAIESLIFSESDEIATLCNSEMVGLRDPSPSVRAAMIAKLPLKERPEILRLLCEEEGIGLRDGDPWVRIWTVKSLNVTNDSMVLKALCFTEGVGLHDARATPYGQTAAAEVASILSAIDDEEIQKCLARYSASQIIALADPDPKVRDQAARNLKPAKDETSRRALSAYYKEKLSELSHPDLVVRERAAFNLTGVFQEDVIRALANTEGMGLRDPCPKVRKSAAVALAGVSDPSAISALSQTKGIGVNDPDRGVASMAQNALKGPLVDVPPTSYSPTLGVRTWRS